MNKINEITEVGKNQRCKSGLGDYELLKVTFAYDTVHNETLQWTMAGTLRVSC